MEVLLYDILHLFSSDVFIYSVVMCDNKPCMKSLYCGPSRFCQKEYGLYGVKSISARNDLVKIEVDEVVHDGAIRKLAERIAM